MSVEEQARPSRRCWRRPSSFRPRRVPPPGDRASEDVYRAGPPRTRRGSGPSGPASCPGSGSGTGCWSGTRRSPSGSSAGKLNVIAQLPRPPPGHGRARTRRAIIWEGEPGDERTLTYRELHREVCKFANVLKAGRGARATGSRIYMPMVPELAIAMLACARIGAPHTVVFGGFSAESLRDRINDAQAKVRDHRRRRLPARRRRPAQARRRTRRSQSARPSRKCVVRAARRRRRRTSTMQPGRDVWWHELMARPPPTARRSRWTRGPALHPLHQRQHRQAQGNRCTRPAAT